MQVHHIGYLVKDMENSILEFRNLGYSISKETSYDRYRDIDICFMSKDGYLVELISPKSNESVVYNMLKKIGNSPYHICYISDNIEKDIQNLCGGGYMQIGEISLAPCISDKSNVVFMFNKHIGIIELVSL